MIRVWRFPSIVALAFEVAPLVRRGLLTDAEGRLVVEINYAAMMAEALDTGPERL